MNPRAPGSRDDGYVGPVRQAGSAGKVGWMKQIALIVIGGLIALTGAIWTLQGLGYISGSFMTGAPGSRSSLPG